MKASTISTLFVSAALAAPTFRPTPTFSASSATPSGTVAGVALPSGTAQAAFALGTSPSQVRPGPPSDYWKKHPGLGEPHWPDPELWRPKPGSARASGVALPSGVALASGAAFPSGAAMPSGAGLLADFLNLEGIALSTGLLEVNVPAQQPTSVAAANNIAVATAEAVLASSATVPNVPSTALHARAEPTAAPAVEKRSEGADKPVLRDGKMPFAPRLFDLSKMPKSYELYMTWE